MTPDQIDALEAGALKALRDETAAAIEGWATDKVASGYAREAVVRELEEKLPSIMATLARRAASIRPLILESRYGVQVGGGSE